MLRLSTSCFSSSLESGENNGDVGGASGLGHLACGTACLFITAWLTLPTLVHPKLSNKTPTGKANRAPYPHPHTMTKAPSKSISSACLAPDLTQVSPIPTLGMANPVGIPYFPGVTFSPSTFDLIHFFQAPLLHPAYFRRSTQHKTICQHGPH